MNKPAQPPSAALKNLHMLSLSLATSRPGSATPMSSLRRRVCQQNDFGATHNFAGFGSQFERDSCASRCIRAAHNHGVCEIVARHHPGSLDDLRTLDDEG